MRRFVTLLFYGVSLALGLAAFLLPLLGPLSGGAGSATDAAFMPVVTLVVVLVCVVALLADAQGDHLGARETALLGVLVALTAVLRLIENAIPAPGGFSPVFAPIILVGFVFGPRFGFLMGALSMLTSALITGGVGPWLPYQMLAAGWIGLGAGALAPILKGRASRSKVGVLAGYGFVSGIAFGWLLNLYFWPFVAGAEVAGVEPAAVWQAYTVFYLASSLVWDVTRGVGTALLLGLLGAPATQALHRFERRLHFDRRTAPRPAGAAARVARPAPEAS